MSTSAPPPMTLDDLCKQNAAIRAVEAHVRSDMRLGIGSGSTIVFAVEHIAKLVKQGSLHLRACVPTSFQATQLIVGAGLPLSDLSMCPELDLALDGADEADGELNLIKGGGGCLTQEKMVAYNAKEFVVIADYRKDSKMLGDKWKRGVPVEVRAVCGKRKTQDNAIDIDNIIDDSVMKELGCWVAVRGHMERLGGRPTLRLAGASKAGPVVTDNGNFILDVDFGTIPDPAALEADINRIPGVISCGLFTHMAKKAYFGQQDGSVKVVDAPAREERATKRSHRDAFGSSTFSNLL